MDARRPTPRQLDALCAIVEFIEEYAICPTHRELATALGIKRVTVTHLVGRLRSKGLIEDRTDAERACEPTGAGRAIVYDRRIATLGQPMSNTSDARHSPDAA